MTTPETVRAAVMPQPHAPVEVRRFPRPVREAGGVVLETIVSEVCGTDVHLWHGRLAGVPYPLIPGHVSVGIVREADPAHTDIEGNPVRIGDTVTFLDVHGTCYNCYTCLVAKTATRCPHRRVYGITYGAGDGLLGGWADQIYLKPGVHIVPLGAVAPETWIAGGCGLPTALHAVDRAEIRLGDRVLIQGAGPVGLCCAALAAASGAAWVGIVDSVPLRREAALRMGADTALPLDSDTVSRVRALTGGRGADVVIEASGSPLAIPPGCEMVRDGGRYVVVGQYTDNGEVAINPHAHLNRKHIELRGCWGSDLSHVWRAVATLARLENRFAWGSLISRHYGLNEAGDALADVEARRVVKAVIAPW